MYYAGIGGFVEAAANPNRTIDTRVVLKSSQGDITLTPEDIVSYKISRMSVAGKYFVPGSFVSKVLELSLNALSSTVSSINFKTISISSLSVEAGIEVNSSMVYVPMGVFYLSDDSVSTQGKDKVSISASDLPPVMSTQFSSTSLSFPCTVGAALNKISQLIGLTIYSSSANFPNHLATLPETFSLTSTYREALRYIAEVLGAYVCMGRNGRVYFKKIFESVLNEIDLGCTLDDSYLFTVSQQENTVKPFQYISIKANESDIGVTKETTVTTGKEYAILGNPFTYGHPEDFLEGLVAPTTFTEFHPSKISFHGRPDIDTGDVIQYSYKGATYLLPVCSHVFEYNGGFKTTLESIGEDSSSTHNASKIQTDIVALRQNINSLIRDLTKTQSDIVDINGDITNMSTLLQTAEQLSSRISSLEGDMEKVSTLEQTAEGMKLSIASTNKDIEDVNKTVNDNQATLLTYFDFQADGLTIGLNTSPIKLRLGNNRIQFLKDGVEVAYLSEGQLFVTDAHFIKTLVLGNFEFTPRANGNLSLRRR